MTTDVKPCPLCGAKAGWVWKLGAEFTKVECSGEGCPMFCCDVGVWQALPRRMSEAEAQALAEELAEAAYDACASEEGPESLKPAAWKRNGAAISAIIKALTGKEPTDDTSADT